MRLRQNHVKVETLEELPLSQGDIEAGVCRDERVMLGQRALCKRGPFRLVVVDRPDMEEPVWLVSNQTAEELSAGALAGLYRQRWEVEGFFPLAQMSAALPALVCGERKRRGHPDLCRADLRGAADAQARTAA